MYLLYIFIGLSFLSLGADFDLLFIVDSGMSKLNDFRVPPLDNENGRAESLSSKTGCSVGLSLIRGFNLFAEPRPVVKISSLLSEPAKFQSKFSF